MWTLGISLGEAQSQRISKRPQMSGFTRRGVGAIQNIRERELHRLETNVLRTGVQNRQRFGFS